MWSFWVPLKWNGYIPSPLAPIPDYKSEWGNTPEQAGHIREFMFGVGEIISGIFCVTVGNALVAGIGIGIVYSGLTRMYTSLNAAWVEHERASLDFKAWESKIKKIAENEYSSKK